MPDRTRKSRDLDQMAEPIVDSASSDQQEPSPDEGKNPAAVALGRLGGHKGGKARAAKLTSEQRSEQARRAAAARWSGRP